MKQRCLFICSPSLGLLDNWIPVLTKIKKSNIKIDIFFPKISTIEQFNTSNFLSQEAIKIFDNVVYQDYFKDLHIAKFNLKFIRSLALDTRFKTIRYRIMKLINKEGFFGDNLFYKLNNILVKLKENHKKINLYYFSNYSFICYDMYEENKTYLIKLNNIFKDIKKFSLHHGSDFPVTAVKLTNYKTKIKNVYPILFSNSKFEENYYKKNFYIEKKMKILGCPKFDKSWSKFVKKQKIQFPFKEKFVLLISRNYDNNYLPLNRKIQYLEIIKKNIIDKNYKLVVKLHPKEDSESGKNFYYKIFGENQYKKKWKFSTDIPLQLSQKVIFVITFFSGVAVDMCSQKKTTIELLNLKGLEKKVSKTDLFYEEFTQEPVFRVRKNGFVLGASNEKEFISKVNWFNSNKKKSNEKFYSHFCKVYKNHENAAQNVYKYIIKNI